MMGKQQSETPHERAERMTREADIRRLYEAGTSLQVLYQLYNAGEVGRVKKKLDDEKMLLELLDEMPTLVTGQYQGGGRGRGGNTRRDHTTTPTFGDI